MESSYATGFHPVGTFPGPTDIDARKLYSVNPLNEKNTIIHKSPEILDAGGHHMIVQ